MLSLLYLFIGTLLLFAFYLTVMVPAVLLIGTWWFCIAEAFDFIVDSLSDRVKKVVVDRVVVFSVLIQLGPSLYDS